MIGLSSISLPTQTFPEIAAKVSKKHIILGIITVAILLTSDISVLGSFDSNNDNQLATAAIKPTITPTVSMTPTVTPTAYPTPIPTLTNEQYLNETVTLHNCSGAAMQIERSDLPKYGHPYNYTPRSDYWNNPACQENSTNSESIQIDDSTMPVQQQTTIRQNTVLQDVNCRTTGNYTHCSDGSSSYQNGDMTQVMGPNSGMCMTNGDYTHCSDGSSSINTGNESFINGPGGNETCTHMGDITHCQ
jgi:hypothetical protein